jgi:hypothetical protein
MFVLFYELNFSSTRQPRTNFLPLSFTSLVLGSIIHGQTFGGNNSNDRRRPSKSQINPLFWLDNLVWIAKKRTLIPQDAQTVDEETKKESEKSYSSKKTVRN